MSRHCTPHDFEMPCVECELEHLQSELARLRDVVAGDIKQIQSLRAVLEEVGVWAEHQMFETRRE